MMNTKEKNIDMIEEKDSLIQNMLIKDLRNLNNKSTFLFKNDSEGLNSSFDNFDLSSIDEYIQNLQLDELKKIINNSIFLNNIYDESLQHKVKITGLDRNIILLIENKKEKATLEQLITYCNKLNIPYKQFLSELF